MNEWISIKDRMPPSSFIESDNDEIEYEAIPILLYVKDRLGNKETEILVGWYEEEVLWPFPNIKSFKSWNGNNCYDLVKECYDVTHWMPLPESPSNINKNGIE